MRDALQRYLEDRELNRILAYGEARAKALGLTEEDVPPDCRTPEGTAARARVIRVTAYTNIYISALNFGGVPRHFLIAARHKRFQLNISQPLMGEVQRILRDRFLWTEDMLQRETVRLSHISALVRPTQTIDAVPEDPDDNRVLECAVAANSRYIATGDNDLLELGSHEGIRIVKVADFLRLLPARH